MLHATVRPARRHSPWLRKHRRSISVALAALIACASAIALSVSGAAPPATWNLPYPRTMSYKILSEDTVIKCNQPDSVFQQQVAAEGVDQYEIDLVDGSRGECGRMKAEQFKRLYPSKMVIAYESPTADDPLQWPGGTWAGYYLLMNRTTAAGAVTAAQTTISVANPSAFLVGDTAVMWSPAGGDAFANSEWVSVTAISGSTLTVTRDFFGTGARAYSSAPLIAAAATGPGYPDPDVNLSDVAPVNPANGERANQWMATNIINDFAPSPGAPSLDGVEFDAASWSPSVHNTNGALENLDCNGDGIVDYCNENVGTAQQVNSYGVGYDAFVHAVKQGLTVYDTDGSRPPKMVLADGESGLRSIDSADGVEFESFPSWDNYTYSSAALDTLGVWTNQDTAPGPHLSYAFTKDVTPLYPQTSDVNPAGCVTPAQGGTCRNGTYRYGMAAALVSGAASAYNNEASFTYSQRWDEEATVDQATTGLTPGYLGQPLGPPTRITRYDSEVNLVTNPSFETDLTGVTTASVVPGAVAVSQDTTTAAPGTGNASLRVDVTAQPADPALTDSRVFDGVTGTLTPGEYTADFWAKTVNNAAGPQSANLGVGLNAVAGAPQVILLTNTWTHYFVQLNATTTVTKNAVLKFSFGSQIGSYWIDGATLHRGTAGIITREFTNGIVVLNDSFTTQTDVPLSGGDYRHINGTQDRTVNDGTDVGSALPAIAAKDGTVLLRDAVSPPTSTTTSLASTSTTLPSSSSTTLPSTTSTTVPGTTSTTVRSSTSTTTSVPPAVVSASDVHATYGGQGVSVSWSAPPDNGSTINSYVVTASPPGRTVTVPGTQTQATLTGLAAGVYTFRVRVSQAGRMSPWSAASNSVIIAALRAPRSGYWMLGSDGKVYAFGSAKNAGSAAGPAVAIAARLDGNGYWTTNWAGDVTHLGTAGDHGGHPALLPGEVVSTISSTPSGNGYWLFTNRGRAFPYGDAQFYGDMSGTALNGPIIASVATATGHGYYMVGSDGGVFSFGDARFHGSTGGMHLNQPIVGISPTPDNRGYWLVASDGGVFAFVASFRGSMGATHLNKAVNGLVAYGNGYLMVASDGGIFDFSDKAFGGSLADDPPTAPILGVAAFAT